MPKRPAVLASVWAVVLLTAAAALGRTGLGSALAVAFLLQVTPSVRTVYRSKDTAGVSRGTWLLILGELLCWAVFGIREADPRLIVLGATGVTASLLVLARVSWPRADRAPATPSGGSAAIAVAVRSPAFGGTRPCPETIRRVEPRGTQHMSWTIERRGRVAVVTMTTNPVNAQNRAFFADLHDAFDRLECDHPHSPVVLTGTGPLSVRLA